LIVSYNVHLANFGLASKGWIQSGVFKEAQFALDRLSVKNARSIWQTTNGSLFKYEFSVFENGQNGLTVF